MHSSYTSEPSPTSGQLGQQPGERPNFRCWAIRTRHSVCQHRVPPLDDVRVRQRSPYATDRQNTSTLWQRLTRRPTGPPPPPPPVHQGLGIRPRPLPGFDHPRLRRWWPRYNGPGPSRSSSAHQPREGPASRTSCSMRCGSRVGIPTDILQSSRARTILNGSSHYQAQAGASSARRPRRQLRVVGERDGAASCGPASSR